MKILFDLFPVILFFGAFKYAEKNTETANDWLLSLGLDGIPTGQAPILLATAVVILATLAQIAWVWSRHGKVDRMLWISFILVVALGSLTIWLRDENFIKWKPTVLYWGMGGALLVAELFQKRPLQSFLGEKIQLPETIWVKLGRIWGTFFIGLGFANLYVAFNFATETWVNFKLFGLTGLLFVFILLQGFYLAKHIQDSSPEQGNT